MTDCLNILYLSPISSIVFNKKYYLVISNLKDHKINLHVIQLPPIDNITEDTIGYKINKVVSGFQDPYIHIKLFEHYNSTITLLLSHTLDFSNIEYNNKSSIILHEPSTKPYTTYKTSTSFLSEQFYNYETYNPSNKCILFFSKQQSTSHIPIVPFIIPVGNDCIYDQYSHMYVSEQPNKQIFIDKNKYEIIPNNFNAAKIIASYRPIKKNHYSNNILLAPVDGRYTNIEMDYPSSTIQTSNGQKYNAKELIGENINVSFAIKATINKYDYQRVCVPYHGYVLNIRRHPKYISIKIHNPYFVSLHVKERDYLSVVFGNAFNTSRLFPELMEPQPNNAKGYTYYLVLFCDKFIYLDNRFVKDEPFWVDTGAHIGYFDTNNMCDIAIISSQNGALVSSLVQNMQIIGALVFGNKTYIKQNDIVKLLL